MCNICTKIKGFLLFLLNLIKTKKNGGVSYKMCELDIINDNLNDKKNNDQTAPLLSGYFICNSCNKIIEYSSNVAYLLQTSAIDYVDMIKLFSKHFHFEKNIIKKLSTIDNFMLIHKFSPLKIKINKWDILNNQTYYFFQEIKTLEPPTNFLKDQCNYFIDLLPVGAIIYDKNKSITYVNKCCEDTLGFNKETFIGHQLLDFFLSFQLDVNYINEQLSRTSTSSQNFVGKVILKKPNNKEIFLEYYVIKDFYKDNSILLLKDETQLKETFEQISHMDSLNVVGQLAAGIAHEIRNPMTSIKGFIQLLKPQLDVNGSFYYDIIMNELERLDLIINEFLYLSKPKNLKFEKKCLTELVQSTLHLMQGQFSLHNIELEVNYPTSNMYVTCVYNELKKVLINLLKNAQEVLSDHGKITIDFGVKDEFYSLSVTDNGIGMTEEQVSQIGKAFFTTKETGVGLGLYVTHKLVEEHNGYISIDSKLNKGTTFTIFLPKFKED